jgi:hypothetical protein
MQAEVVLSSSPRPRMKLAGKREDFRVQRLANEKPGIDHGVHFSPNVAHQSLTVRFKEEAKGSDHDQTQSLGRPTRWAIIEQDLASGYLERQRNRLCFTGIKGRFPRERVAD